MHVFAKMNITARVGANVDIDNTVERRSEVGGVGCNIILVAQQRREPELLGVSRLGAVLGETLLHATSKPLAQRGIADSDMKNPHTRRMPGEPF
jgi:hypothetical protein